jgi:hypothetical protein
MQNHQARAAPSSVYRPSRLVDGVQSVCESESPLKPSPVYVCLERLVEVMMYRKDLRELKGQSRDVYISL